MNLDSYIKKIEAEVVSILSSSAKEKKPKAKKKKGFMTPTKEEENVDNNKNKDAVKQVAIEVAKIRKQRMELKDGNPTKS